MNELVERACVDAATRSDCSKVGFGAVALDEAGRILSVGWNHIPEGRADCAGDCVGGIRSGVESGTKLERCHAVHAEQHAVIRAKGAVHAVAVIGILPDGSRFDNGGGFYCTMCARIMAAAGVKVVWIWSDRWIKLTMDEAWNQSYSMLA